MAEQLKLMCVLAHPDDESLGTGGTLAKYAAEGIETYLVTATRGERGWNGDEQDNPGLEALGKTREAELFAAARVLGLREVKFLDYIDGDLDQSDPLQIVARILGHLRRVKPQVVITFGPDGVTGHPDHIAVSQFTTAAVLAAPDPSFSNSDQSDQSPPHRVSKLYYMSETKAYVAAYRTIFGDDIGIPVDGVERGLVPWEAWAITTWIDAEAHWQTVWRAVACHQSQMPTFSRMQNLPESHRRTVWGTQTYYRALSMVNGGRKPETDLFEGLRCEP